MKKISFMFMGLLFGSLLHAAEDARLVEARQAMADGLPQVAIHKLSEEGEGLASKKPEIAGVLLSEALLAANRSQEAIYVLEKMPQPPTNEVSFLLAEAFAAADRPQQALSLYEKLAADKEFANREAAAIGHARAFTALNRDAQAMQVLAKYLAEGLVSNPLVLELARHQLNASQAVEAAKTLNNIRSPSIAEQQEIAYVLARADLARGDLQAADKHLAEIQHPDRNLQARIILTRAEVQIQENDLSAAEKILEEFLESHPRHPLLLEVFAQLDRVYTLEGAASTTELRRWSENPEQPDRANLALFYLARVEKRVSKLERSWQHSRNFLNQASAHPLADTAKVELASSLLASGRPGDAIKALEQGAGCRVDFVRGEIFAALGKYDDAAESFLKAADEKNIEDDALYNSAVCGMLAGLASAKNRAIPKLVAKGNAAVLEKLRFTEALYQASQRQPSAVDLLRSIASEQSAYSAQARLALAEWEDLQLNITGAQNELKLIANADPATQERKEYLEIFLADTGEPNAEAQVTLRAEAFLRNFPVSSYEPDVRMKLGEMRFRSGDYLGARGQFDALVAKFPDSPMAEKALFLAAQALARSMDPKAMKEAIDVYEDVVRQGGPLATRARLSEALLQNSLHQPEEAIGILDSILAGTPDNEMRFTVLMEKGDTQFSMGTKDAQNYRNAIATWSSVAKNPEATPQWRNQALSKMGKAHEKLGETDAALANYYDVLSGGQNGEPEYFWFYKAGFDAGRLLESKELLNEAIALYAKLSAVEGPRAQEASSLVNKLRLENFIWEN